MAKILIVEDVYTARLKAELVLRNSGFYAVTSTSTGRDALTIAQLDPPDIIVMDVVMADMDGITTMRKLRALGITCPIIAYTARNEFCPGEFEGHGFDAYVSKAESMSQLISTMKSLLRQKAVGYAATTLHRPFATAADYPELEVLN